MALNFRSLSAISLLAMVGGGCANESISTYAPSTTPTTRVASTTTTHRQTTSTSAPSAQVFLACPDDVEVAIGSYHATFTPSILITAEEFESASIYYGDDKRYSSDSLDDAMSNMFWHGYQSPGNYTVRLSVELESGESYQAQCRFEWTAPPELQAFTAATACDPNYSGCVPIDSDVDCAGGSGNGPSYVRGPVQVLGNDVYGLDRDGDGIGCE